MADRLENAPPSKVNLYLYFYQLFQKRLRLQLDSKKEKLKKKQSVQLAAIDESMHGTVKK